MRLVFSIMVLLSLGEPKRTGWEQNIAVYIFFFFCKAVFLSVQGTIIFLSYYPNKLLIGQLALILAASTTIHFPH